MVRIDLQNDESLPNLPSPAQFEHWVAASLQSHYDDLEQTIRVVDAAESRLLNHQYRAKDAATNVLSFPAESEYLDYDCLGDLVICAPIVADEAHAQGKSAEAHWAHMLVHGMLHLQGFDHQSESEADEMERLEVKILATLGYSSPYNDQ